MPIQSRKTYQRTRGIFILSLLAVALLFVSGCEQAPKEDKNTTQDFLTQKAKESGGDFSKLSPEDQKKVQERTQGHGPAVIRARASQ